MAEEIDELGDVDVEARGNGENDGRIVDMEAL